MSFRNKFLIFLTNIYFFVIGLGWISLHVYLRFIRERNPYDLTAIKSQINFQIILMLFAIIIFHFIIIIMLLYKLYKVYVTKIEFNNKLNIYLSNFVDYIYWKPLSFFHDLIITKIPNSGIFLFKLGKILYKFHPEKLTFLFSAIVFNYLPQILIVICLIIDVFVYKRIYYFFASLGLIIIPMSFQIFIKILSNFCQVNLSTIKQVIEIKSDPEKGPQWFLYYKKSSYNFITDEEFLEWIEAWEILTNFEIYTNNFKNFKDKHASFVTIFCSSGYIISWTYYLYFILKDSSLNIVIMKFFTVAFLSLVINFDIYIYIEEPFSGLFI